MRTADLKNLPTDDLVRIIAVLYDAARNSDVIADWYRIEELEKEFPGLERIKR